MSLLLAGVSLSLMSPFYPSEALSKGVSVTQSGLVMGSIFISTIVFTPFFGAYMDLLGARKFLLLGSLVCGAGNIAFGFLDKIEDGDVFFTTSLVIRVIVALGESSMTPACYALASQQVETNNQGKALSVAEAAFGVGTMFGPTLGGFFYEFGGFLTPFLATGISLVTVGMMATVCMQSRSNQYKRLEKSEMATWRQVLCAPGVGVAVFGLIFAGSSWSWYSATLEPFLGEMYGFSASKTGLVFTTFGAAYTLITPVFGVCFDKGVNKLAVVIFGNTLIAVGFIFLGPIPQLSAISGHVWLTILSIGVQGIGSAATYLGTLLLMLQGVKTAKLPENEQVKSMVSSLWIVSDCLGGFAGSSVGSIAYDHVGFKQGSLIEACVLASTSIVMAAVFFYGFSSCSDRSITNKENKDLDAYNADEDQRRQLIAEGENNDKLNYGT